MKLFKFLSMVFALAPSLAFAGDVEGGNSGGGGNLEVLLSTPTQIHAAIENARTKELADFLRLFAFDDFKHGNISDPEVRAVLSRFFGGARGTNLLNPGTPFVDFSLQAALKTTKIVEQHKPCSAPHGLLTDASVSALKLGTPVCFNVNSLRWIADDQLQAQVTALLAHEMAHEYGFGESAAVKIQNYVLRTSVYGFTGEIYTGFRVHITASSHDHENVIVNIRGDDAKAIYDRLSSPSVYSDHSETNPPGWDKKGENISCVRYEIPIRDNSPFAKFLKTHGELPVLRYDYSCNIHLFSETGKVGRPW